VNEWEIAAVVLTVAIGPCVAVCMFGTAAAALAALEVASTVATTALIALAEGFHRQPFIDLALVLGVLSVVGALAFARLMEGDI
jgi:multisubunit Na+/H+ antiporter MnhF subunit